MTEHDIYKLLDKEWREILGALRSPDIRDDRTILGLQEAEIIILQRMKKRLEALPAIQ